MRSFASVAVTLDGTEHGRFEAVLEELPGASPNAETLAWFHSIPEAWEAATANPEPVAADGVWIDYYLRRYTQYGILQGPYEDDRLFGGTGLCIRSYAAAVTGRPAAELSPSSLPDEWFGDVRHTHNAIDDALGYANLLVTLTRRAADSAPTHYY